MVIYFSGNGNSKSIAVAASKKLSCRYIALEGKNLVNPASFVAECRDSDIVWVFPVYSWGIPPVVVRFIEKCRLDCAGSTHHLVVTCGDDAGLTSRQWRRLIASRGWATGCSASVIMPNTYVLMKGFDTDIPETVARKLTAAPKSLDHAIDMIKSHSTADTTNRGSFAWIKSRIIHPWFCRHAMSAKPFHATADCTSCGLCAKQCPMLNITIDADGQPRWGDNCALCLRCYHRCPSSAVAYGNATKGKHRYAGPEAFKSRFDNKC